MHYNKKRNKTQDKGYLKKKIHLQLFNSLSELQTKPENQILYICDFRRGVLNVRLCARIQHLLPGHKYRGFGFLASVLWLDYVKLK